MLTGTLQQFKQLGIRHALLQALNFATVISTALAIWKGLSIVTNTESPIVVVLSGSMEPAFQRGDLLFLSLPWKSSTEELKVGDITVYNVPGAKIPIVHRIIETHNEAIAAEPIPQKSIQKARALVKTRTPKQRLLTKGDNNPGDDVPLYNGLKYLERSNIVGRVKGYMPWVGYITIVMNDYPNLKYALLGSLGLWILVHRE